MRQTLQHSPHNPCIDFSVYVCVRGLLFKRTRGPLRLPSPQTCVRGETLFLRPETNSRCFQEMLKNTNNFTHELVMDAVLDIMGFTGEKDVATLQLD